MMRPNAAPMPRDGGYDIVFASRGDGDDDVLSTPALNSVLNVGLRPGRTSCGQDKKSGERQRTHSAGCNHAPYYSKVSAMAEAADRLTDKSFLNSKIQEKFGIWRMTV